LFPCSATKPVDLYLSEDYTSRTSYLLISNMIRKKEKKGRQTPLNTRRWHEKRKHIL